MYPVRISVSITGTDDNGDVRNWAATGQFECTGATDNNITVGTSHVKIVECGSSEERLPTYLYVENYGDNDIAYGMYDPNGATLSHAIPAGASLFIKVHGHSDNIDRYIEAVELWAATGTSNVRYIMFY